MVKREKNARRKLPIWKKSLFSLITCAVFFVMLELLLLACGIQPILYEEDPCVGFTASVPLFVQEKRSDNVEVMVRATNKGDFFNAQEFPAEKSRDTFRIFCVGGSTTYGRPFGDNSSFCGWLREMLPEIDSSRQWEVINAGGISYASYRVALLMEELVNYEPDLFVVYSGHNEFLEHRTYAGIIATPAPVRGVAAWAAGTRTYSLMRRLVHQESPRAELPAEVETLLDRSIGPSAYTRDDALQEQILAHYRYNLARMVDIAHSAGARVVFITPASNIRDCSPFKSEHRNDLSAADAERWQRLLGTAKVFYESAAFERALATLRQAKEIDGRYANLHFLEGRVLENIGRFSEAKQAYVRARDEDICPLRALTQMPVIAKEVAADRGVGIIDYAADVERRAENGISGKKQFLDHVHPTIQEHRELATAIVDYLCETDSPLHAAPQWVDVTNRNAIIERAKDRIEARIDREANGLAMMNLSKVMGWAGKVDDAYVAAKRAVELAPQATEAHYHLATCAQKLGKMDEALVHYRRALDVDVSKEMPTYYPGALNNLGILHASRGDLSDAVTYYQRAVEADFDFVEGHYNLGVVYIKQGDLVKASAEFREVLRIFPDCPEAHLELGSLMARKGELSKAASHLEEAVRLRPDDANMHVALATVYANAERLEDAEASARKALKLARIQGQSDLVKEIESQLRLIERRRAAN